MVTSWVAEGDSPSGSPPLPLSYREILFVETDQSQGESREEGEEEEEVEKKEKKKKRKKKKKKKQWRQFNRLNPKAESKDVLRKTES